MIGLANSAEVDALWPQLAPRFQEAIDAYGDDISLGEYWQMCRAGSAFLMVAMDGSRPMMGAVLQFQKWSKGSALRCLLLAGTDIQRWMTEFEAAVLKMMEEGGARRFVFEGRDGWARKLLHRKPKRLRVTYEVEI